MKRSRKIGQYRYINT